MIKINSLKLNIEKASSNEAGDLKILAAKKLKVPEREITGLNILKKSIDARDKGNILFIYTISVSLGNEEKVLKKIRDNNISAYEPVIYDPINILSGSGVDLTNRIPLSKRPVIVGFGPAGMMCALKLAEAGYRPVVIERGDSIENRSKAVDHFWKTGELDPETNVQFGEGGAGAFSDGKLNTMVNDPLGRIPEVFRVFIEHGAAPEIAYINKPHVGTDVLHRLVASIRERILMAGGEVFFNTCLRDIKVENGQIKGITVSHKNESSCSEERIDCSILVLATGHSSRDTFRMLYEKGLAMEAKSFAVGFRVRHEQDMIGRSQYGSAYNKLPAADYKVTYQASNGRGVYSFCMCPGGYVVNASSEPGRTCVNGMSYSGRDGSYANSAIVVTVNADDFSEDKDIFSGLIFQEKMEQEAYKRGKGAIPVQRLCDYRMDRETTDDTDLEASKAGSDNGIKGRVAKANLRHLYPEFIDEAILEAMPAFGRKIGGFDRDDTLLLGIESRTSSPVRIRRNEGLISESIDGIYPCGEGAGYAGGITSACVDGLKIFEQIYGRYLPFNL